MSCAFCGRTAQLSHMYLARGVTSARPQRRCKPEPSTYPQNRHRQRALLSVPVERTGDDVRRPQLWQVRFWYTSIAVMLWSLMLQNDKGLPTWADLDWPRGRWGRKSDCRAGGRRDQPGKLAPHIPATDPSFRPLETASPGALCNPDLMDVVHRTRDGPRVTPGSWRPLLSEGMHPNCLTHWRSTKPPIQVSGFGVTYIFHRTTDIALSYIP